MQWKLETLAIEELNRYAKNPRTLGERGHRRLCDSIDKFGLVEKPVVNADGTIISGHQRLEVLRERGLA